MKFLNNQKIKASILSLITFHIFLIAQAADKAHQHTDRVLTLAQAMQGFNSYMHHLITVYNLPHQHTEQEKDMQDTWFALTYHATGNWASDTVPFDKVLEIKRNYKQFLLLLYPEQLKKQVPEQTMSRSIAKKRIKSEFLQSSDTSIKNAQEVHRKWKQFKHDFINPQLDAITFVDNNGLLVVSYEDFVHLLTKIKKNIRF